jgi:hypothetical protein
MVSTTVMIQRLEGCLGTGDLTDWQEGFVRNLAERMHAGEVTALSAKQIDTLEQLHDRRFG